MWPALSTALAEFNRTPIWTHPPCTARTAPNGHLFYQLDAYQVILIKEVSSIIQSWISIDVAGVSQAHNVNVFISNSVLGKTRGRTGKVGPGMQCHQNNGSCIYRPPGDIIQRRICFFGKTASSKFVFYVPFFK